MHRRKEGRDTFAPHPLHSCLMKIKNPSSSVAVHGQEMRRKLEGVKNRKQLPLQHNISGHLPARAKRLLRLAVYECLDPSGVTERQRKLILSFPLPFLSRTQQRLLRTAVVDLDDDPAQLSRLQIKHHLVFGCS